MSSVRQRYHLGDEVLVLRRHLPSKATKTDKGRWERGRVIAITLRPHHTLGEVVGYDVMTFGGRALSSRDEQDLRCSAIDELANVARRAGA